MLNLLKEIEADKTLSEEHKNSLKKVVRCCIDNVDYLELCDALSEEKPVLWITLNTFLSRLKESL